jgi:O-methyltransferase
MPNMRSSIIHTLDLLHLRNFARRTKRFAKQWVRRPKRAVRAHVLWGWKPLVPEHEFTECSINAIKILRRFDPDQALGDYLEFGVSRGTSLACMYRALEHEGLFNVRLFGFDSFRGFPPEAATQGWTPGNAWSTLSATRRYLVHNGVDMRRVTLIKGWFKDTLTAETRDRLGIVKASLIMIDCDIYSASRDALLFSGPMIRDEAVIFFDDWGGRADRGKIGQKEAFEEFLAEFPLLAAEPLPSYLPPQARVFLVHRHRDRP